MFFLDKGFINVLACVAQHCGCVGKEKLRFQSTGTPGFRTSGSEMMFLVFTTLVLPIKKVFRRVKQQLHRSAALFVGLITSR